MNKKTILIICVVLVIIIIGAVIAYTMIPKETNDNKEEKSNNTSSNQVEEKDEEEEKDTDVKNTNTNEDNEDNEDKAEKDEKDVYNSSIKNAIGDDIKGSEVKRMIDNIILSNTENVNVNGKFISIETGEITNYDKAADLASACKKANTYEGGKNTQENISAAQEEIIILRNKLNSGKDYKVTAEEESGVIYKVKIEEK